MNQEDYYFDISKKITHVWGLDFQPNQWKDMVRRVAAAAQVLKIEPTIENLHQWICKETFANHEINALSDHLTINETYFFRETTALELFRKEIIPTLISERRGRNERIKIWSAGCSSGEEPYTLAIILKEFFPELANWEITIIATDISTLAIQKALHGEFTEWSFRNTDEQIKKKYFTPEGKNWHINTAIKKMISFSYLNLSKNAYPSAATNTEAVDVIFCRNVMMYFTPPVIKEVSGRFNNCLSDNGWFITSQVELNDDYFSNFERIHYSNGIFYRKTNRPKNELRPFLDIKRTETAVQAVKERRKIVSEKQERKTNQNKPPEGIAQNQTDPADYFEQGEYKKCIESCLNRISNGGVNNQLFAVLIKSYANLGQPDDSHIVLTQILNSNAANAGMYYIYASLLNEHNDLEQTEYYLKRAIYLNHNHILSHLMLGDIYLKTNKKQLAIRHYENILKIVNGIPEHEIVPESDGITVGRIKEFTENIINSL